MSTIYSRESFKESLKSNTLKKSRDKVYAALLAYGPCSSLKLGEILEDLGETHNMTRNIGSHLSKLYKEGMVDETGRCDIHPKTNKPSMVYQARLQSLTKLECFNRELEKATETLNNALYNKNRILKEIHDLQSKKSSN
jgi:DNA-binding transcriptional ArsR family regulator